MDTGDRMSANAGVLHGPAKGSAPGGGAASLLASIDKPEHTLCLPSAGRMLMQTTNWNPIKPVGHGKPLFWLALLTIAINGCTMNETQQRTGSGAAIGAAVGAIGGGVRAIPPLFRERHFGVGVDGFLDGFFESFHTGVARIQPRHLLSREDFDAVFGLLGPDVAAVAK